MPDFAEEFDSRGFHLGVFRGVRSFQMDEDGWLTGMVYRQRWTNEVNEAECRRSTTWVHGYVKGIPTTIPAETLPPEHGMSVCRHGFYAYGDESRDYHQTGFVSGVIYGWGKEVMIGTRGFRCMRARIAALCMSEVKLAQRSRVELVHERYFNIPFYDTFEAMVADYPPDWPGQNEGEAA